MPGVSGDQRGGQCVWGRVREGKEGAEGGRRGKGSDAARSGSVGAMRPSVSVVTNTGARGGDGL